MYPSTLHAMYHIQDQITSGMHFCEKKNVKQLVTQDLTVVCLGPWTRLCLLLASAIESLGCCQHLGFCISNCILAGSILICTKLPGSHSWKQAVV